MNIFNNLIRIAEKYISNGIIFCSLLKILFEPRANKYLSSFVLKINLYKYVHILSYTINAFTG